MIRDRIMFLTVENMLEAEADIDRMVRSSKQLLKNFKLDCILSEMFFLEPSLIQWHFTNARKLGSLKNVQSKIDYSKDQIEIILKGAEISRKSLTLEDSTNISKYKKQIEEYNKELEAMDSCEEYIKCRGIDLNTYNVILTPSLLR